MMYYCDICGEFLDSDYHPQAPVHASDTMCERCYVGDEESHMLTEGVKELDFND